MPKKPRLRCRRAGLFSTAGFQTMLQAPTCLSRTPEQVLWCCLWHWDNQAPYRPSYCAQAGIHAIGYDNNLDETVNYTTMWYLLM